MNLQSKVAWAEYCKYSDKALDWFINSWNFGYETDEWQVCRLKMKIYNKKAKYWIKRLVKEIKNG